MNTTTDPHIQLQMDGLLKRFWDLQNTDGIFVRFIVSVNDVGIQIQLRRRPVPGQSSEGLEPVRTMGVFEARQHWNNLVAQGHVLINSQVVT